MYFRLGSRHWSPLAILDYGNEEFYTSASNPRCLLTANLAVRREWFSTIGDFSSRYPRCQDHELRVRLWRAGARALYVPAMCVRARVPPEQPREIPVLDGRMIAPFDQTRLSTVMARTADDPDRRALLGAMLRDCLDRYEHLRASGEHHGPPLRGIRLYDERWTLDPQAANVDAPDRRLLIAEAGSPARSTAN